MGMMNTYGTIIGILTAALGYGTEAASLFGAVFIIGGIIGSAVFGVIVEVKKNYRVVTIIICGLSSLFAIALSFSLLSNNIVLGSIGCACAGFAMISILPVGMDFGVELTHPTPEPVSSGLLMSAGAVIGIIQTIIASESIHYFEERGKPITGCIVAQCSLILCGMIAFVMSIFVKEDLRRINEAKDKEILQNQLEYTAPS